MALATYVGRGATVVAVGSAGGSCGSPATPAGTVPVVGLEAEGEAAAVLACTGTTAGSEVACGEPAEATVAFAAAAVEAGRAGLEIDEVIGTAATRTGEAVSVALGADLRVTAAGAFGPPAASTVGAGRELRDG